jgi:hypothetical protein
MIMLTPIIHAAEILPKYCATATLPLAISFSSSIFGVNFSSSFVITSVDASMRIIPTIAVITIKIDAHPIFTNAFAILFPPG